MYSEDRCHVRFAAPWRSNSAATSRPRRPASAAGAVALARNADAPSSAATTALSCSISVPAAYAPTGALQPAANPASTARSAVTAARLAWSSTWASSAARSLSAAAAFHRQRALPGRGQHLFRLEDLGHGVQPADPGQPGAGQQHGVQLARFDLAQPGARVAADRAPAGCRGAAAAAGRPGAASRCRQWPRGAGPRTWRRPGRPARPAGRPRTGTAASTSPGAGAAGQVLERVHGQVDLAGRAGFPAAR